MADVVFLRRSVGQVPVPARVPDVPANDLLGRHHVADAPRAQVPTAEDAEESPERGEPEPEAGHHHDEQRRSFGYGRGAHPGHGRRTLAWTCHRKSAVAFSGAAMRERGSSSVDSSLPSAYASAPAHAARGAPAGALARLGARLGPRARAPARAGHRPRDHRVRALAHLARAQHRRPARLGSDGDPPRSGDQDDPRLPPVPLLAALRMRGTSELGRVREREHGRVSVVAVLPDHDAAPRPARGDPQSARAGLPAAANAGAH